MTVRINKPALNLREELTKAQGVVRYEQRQFWMDGLVENGTFDTDASGWIANNANVSVSNGVVTVTNTGSYGFIQQTIPIKAGRYKFIYEKVSGSPLVGLLSTSGTPTYVSNSSLDDINFTVSTAHDLIVRVGNTVSGVGAVSSFDNVKLFEVDENDNVIHSLPLGWKPLHVYEDGLIQREGDVHDYTVVKTGGAYAIKPAVQPTGSTETCVIAEREL